MKHVLFSLVAATALASGVAALGHELLWTRRLVDLLGATHESLTRVIACFFLGLSAGAALAAVRFHNTARPWRCVAIVELAVAGLCLPIVFLPEIYGSLLDLLASDTLCTVPDGVASWLIAAAAVLPPSIGMGMTLPLMVGGLQQAGHGATRSLDLYAANTLGGVLGVSLISTGLVWVGVRNAILFMMLLNLLVACLCWLWDRRVGPRTMLESSTGVRPEHVIVSGRDAVDDTWLAPMLLAFCSGFGILACEILSIHLFAHVVSTFHATASVLAVFVFILFAAAAIAAWLVRFGINPRTAVTCICLGCAVLITSAPVIFLWLTDELATTFDTSLTAPHFLGSLILLVTACLGPGILLASMLFPFSTQLFHVAPAALTRYWGWLLMANGIGGFAGAEVANNVLMYGGLYLGFGWVGLGYAMLGTVFIFVGSTKSMAPTSFAAAASVLACFILVAWVLPTLPVVNDQSSARVVGVVSGPEGVISVVERELELSNGRHLSRAMLWNSQYTLGGTLARYDEQRQAVLPLAVHPAPESVAMLGLATGITAGTALVMPDVEQITVIEISQQVIDAAEAYFGAYHRGITSHPRATMIREDARTYIAVCQDQFDVIVADLFRPFATGEGRLFTTEHFHSVRRALRPGGLYCHWIPCYQVDHEEMEVIMGSFLEAFGEAEVWRANLKSQYSVVGLFGYRDGAMKLDHLLERCARIRAAGAILDPPSRHAESIAMHYVGPLRLSEIRTAQRNTLNNAWLELRAGWRHSTQSGRKRNLEDAQWHEFEQDLYQRVGARSAAAGELANWRAAGLAVSHWYHANSKKPPAQQVAELWQAAQSALPASMRDDTHADWTFWPQY